MHIIGLEKTSLIWKQIAQSWVEYFTSPSRPSNDEVKQYIKWLRKIAKNNVDLKGLVLGATPELRDALVQTKFKSYLVDINLEMILAMSDLLKHPNLEEVIVKANWLDNPLRDHCFDVILGDAVIPNLPWEKRTEFYKEVSRLLKPEGYFINRAFFIPEKKPFKKIEDLLNSFSERETTKAAALQLVFEIQIFTYNPKDRLGSMEKVYKVVEKLRGKDGFRFDSEKLNKTLDIVWNYWLKTARSKVWIYPYQKEEQAEYKNYFKIIDIYTTKDHPYGKITPMYLLKIK